MFWWLIWIILLDSFLKGVTFLINIRKKVSILLFSRNHRYLSAVLLHSLCNYFSSKNPVHRIITNTQCFVDPVISTNSLLAETDSD